MLIFLLYCCEHSCFFKNMIKRSKDWVLQLSLQLPPLSPPPKETADTVKLFFHALLSKNQNQVVIILSYRQKV